MLNKALIIMPMVNFAVTIFFPIGLVVDIGMWSLSVLMLSFYGFINNHDTHIPDDALAMRYCSECGKEEYISYNLVAMAENIANENKVYCEVCSAPILAEHREENG